MRFLRRPLAFALSMLILLGFLFSQASAAETEKRLTILFTHDTHDHFLPMPFMSTPGSSVDWACSKRPIPAWPRF